MTETADAKEAWVLVDNGIGGMREWVKPVGRKGVLVMTISADEEHGSNAAALVYVPGADVADFVK